MQHRTKPNSDDTQTELPLALDRAAHCRRIGASGVVVTVAKHGRWHMAAIGTAGARVTIERHGVGYWRGLVNAKGWTAPRPPVLLADLAAGRACRPRPRRMTLHARETLTDDASATDSMRTDAFGRAAGRKPTDLVRVG